MLESFVDLGRHLGMVVMVDDKLPPGAHIMATGRIWVARDLWEQLIAQSHSVEVLTEIVEDADGQHSQGYAPHPTL